MSQIPHPPCTVVLPVKQTHIAKSRLASLGEQARRELALAFAFDAVAAALDAAVVRRVLVVTNDDVGSELARLGADVIRDEPDAGLNPALAFAAAQARCDEPGSTVVAMSADLPALRGVDLDLAWELRRPPRWFVPDCHGDGTTLLAAHPGHDLAPAFGPGSRRAHRDSGAIEILDERLSRLRRDVDTEQDLEIARSFGVGDRTAAVLASTLDRRLA
ncbi:MAG: 2-phospho-L-lactate guanylyltransferase [Nocardioidaceae bacterium]